MLRVCVNRVPQLRWRGAAWSGTAEVMIEDLGPSDSVTVELVAHADRLHELTWERASRHEIHDISFTPDPRASVVAKVPRASTDTPDPQLDAGIQAPGAIHVPVEAIRSHSPMIPPLVRDEAQTWAISTDSFVLPLMIVPRSEADSSLVLCNGAVDLERSQGLPVHQRSTWRDSLNQHLVFVCDPGTIGPEALSLAWGVLPGGAWCIPEASQAVRSVLDLIEAGDDLPRLYYGSSAGGFWALGLMHFDDGSAALINNAQFDWTRWMAGSVNKLRAARFNNALPADLRRLRPVETSVLRLLQTSSQLRQVDYHVNTASPHDLTVALPQAEAFVIESGSAGHDFRIHRYADAELGHNPLPRESTIRLMDESLRRMTGDLAD